jgi:transcriptional regulator with XRE-family HTH domain
MLLLMAGSPTVRRRRLLRELHRLRHAAGKTIDEVADEVGMSKSTLSRIENGQVGIKLPLLRSLLECYGVTGAEAAAVRQLHREANQRGWWQDAEAPASEYYRMLAGLEDEADQVEIFQSAFIPGLLQTRDYAQAIVAAIWPDRTPEDRTRAVEFRLRRQRRVGALRLWVILAEEVLLREVAGTEVMAAQLTALINAAEHPPTTLQILPLSAGAHIAMAGPFSILTFTDPHDPSVVYLEGSAGERYLEEEDLVGAWSHRFDLLRATALSQADSLQLLRHHVESFGR